MEKKMFTAEVYDASDKASRLDEWERRSSIYVATDSIEKATKAVRASLGEDEVLIGISEMQNTRFIVD